MHVKTTYQNVKESMNFKSVKEQTFFFKLATEKMYDDKA